MRYDDHPLLFVFGPQYYRSPDAWEALFDGLPDTPALVTLDGNLSFAALASYPWPPMNLSGGIELQPDVLQTYLERFYRNARRQHAVIGGFPGLPRHLRGSRSAHQLRLHRPPRRRHAPHDIRRRPGGQRQPHPTRHLERLRRRHDHPADRRTGYQALEIVQQYRTELDDQGFAYTPDDLRLPLRLFELRKAHAGDDAADARLDAASEAILGGDLTAAADILAAFKNLIHQRKKRGSCP